MIHIIPSLRKGGAERLVLDICNALSKQNDVTVRLITFTKENEYKFLTDTIDWEVVPAKVTPSITKKWHIDVEKLQRKIAAFQPDIIHSHLFETEMVLARTSLPINTKRLVHFHDNMAQFRRFTCATFWNKKLITNYFERTAVLKAYKKRSVQFIGVSKDTTHYIQRNIPKEFLCHFLPNAIDTARFQPPATPSFNNKITTIGSLVDKKGLTLAVETINILKQRNILVHLDILGDGPNKNRLEAKIEENKLNHQISLQGNVDKPEQFLRKSIVYLHTAKSESFGLVLLEAMACGLPVVCTDGKGNRDLIKEGENGFIIWERNPALLADKIELLLQDETLRKEMGEKARKFAQDFGIESYVEKLLETYKNLAK